MSGNHYSHNQEKGIYHFLKYYTSLVNIEVMFSQKKKVNEMKQMVSFTAAALY